MFQKTTYLVTTSTTMNFEPVDSAQDDQIIITILEDGGQNLCAQSIDFIIGAMQLRISPRSDQRLRSVFHDPIADHIEDVCTRASQPRQMVNVPDFSLSFRDLTVRGYTLIVHTLDSGLRQFIIKLKQAVGNALAIFGDWDAGDCGLAIGRTDNTFDGNTTSARLFDEMLAHLYLPLSNLNMFLNQAIDAHGVNRETGFGGSIVQLKTKAEMLQFAFDRLISEVMLDKYSGADRRGQARDGLPQTREQWHARHGNM